MHRTKQGGTWSFMGFLGGGQLERCSLDGLQAERKVSWSLLGFFELQLFTPTSDSRLFISK